MPNPKAASPRMAAVGLTWLDLTGMADHLIHLLETDGETALDLVRTGMKLMQDVSSHDFVAIFQDLNAARVDVQKLIADIKQEFDITP